MLYFCCTLDISTEGSVGIWQTAISSMLAVRLLGFGRSFLMRWLESLEMGEEQ